MAPMTPKALAEEINRDPTWDCLPVKLLVCWAGKGTFATELAKELGKLGPRAKVWATPDLLYWMDSPYLAPNYYVAEGPFLPFGS
jgi:hypothetical protein